MIFNTKEINAIKNNFDQMLLGKINPENALLFFQHYRNKLIVSRDMRASSCCLSPELQKSMQEEKQIENDANFLDHCIKTAQGMIAKQPEETHTIEQISQNEEISQEETGFIRYIKDEGQIDKTPADNGKYNLIDNAENFVGWYIYNNYDEYENFGFLPNYMMKYINHDCTLETLKRYVREARKTALIQIQNNEKMKNLKESR